jgi:hypothetical protein
MERDYRAKANKKHPVPQMTPDVLLFYLNLNYSMINFFCCLLSSIGIFKK